MKIPETGETIESYCTRCKLNLDHRIVAMVGDVIKRVWCLTCESEHNYRKPKPEKASARKPKAATRVPAAVTKLRNEWSAHVNGQPPGAFTPYSMDREFAEGELVQHKKF